MLKINPRTSKARKKPDERSEFILAFDFAFAFRKFTTKFAKKLPQELSESEVQ